ncbi:hypothetical protein JVU11DRAFT_6793 [Chiua virens]|nr:hypothetical protein JVU11DRAFT_6793 [Chiua virens]
MEDWIKTLCWPMGYNHYQAQRNDELRDRIRDAVRLLQHSRDDFTSHGHYSPSRMHGHSLHVPHEHQMQRSHSHSHVPVPVEPTLSFDFAIVPYDSGSHGSSPLDSPPDSVHISMPEPWHPTAPIVMMPSTRAF